jgi:hypothetical protein
MSAMTRRMKAEAAKTAAATPARPRDRHRYWLVQRLVSVPANIPGRTGFDALFGCAYMGSAEFEWGAMPDSLKRIRSAKRLVIEPREVTWAGVTRTVWFVGPEQGMAEKIADWDAWRIEENCRGKESSYFPQAFGGHLEDWHHDPIAWWSLRDDIAWALDVETAEKLLAGFSGKTAKR